MRCFISVSRNLGRNRRLNFTLVFLEKPKNDRISVSKSREKLKNEIYQFCNDSLQKIKTKRQFCIFGETEERHIIFLSFLNHVGKEGRNISFAYREQNIICIHHAWEGVLNRTTLTSGITRD